MSKNIQKNKVIHFEIAVGDFERAKKFYSSLFDWKFVTWGEGDADYVLIQTVETDDRGMPEETGGINGGMFKRPNKLPEGEGPPSSSDSSGASENAYVCTVEVSDIDETLKKVQASGGKIIMPKKEIPQIGFSARCLDLDGNIFGLLQSSR